MNNLINIRLNRQWRCIEWNQIDLIQLNADIQSQRYKCFGYLNTKVHRKQGIFKTFWKKWKKKGFCRWFHRFSSWNPDYVIRKEFQSHRQPFNGFIDLYLPNCLNVCGFFFAICNQQKPTKWLSLQWSR